jgi:hypothetical protein
MWEILGRERLHVIIPYAKRIWFQNQANRRNPEMLLSLIKSHAVMFSLQRERQEAEGISCIIATRADFDYAVRLYNLLNGSTGGQTTKLTKMESDLLGTIASLHFTEFTIPMLQKVTGLSNAVLHRLIHGYMSRGSAYSGLLEKCPAIAFTDRTVVSDDNQIGRSTRRRTNAYTFDAELFRKWIAGGAVWLGEDPDDNRNHRTESRESGSGSMEISASPGGAESAAESDILSTNTLLNVQMSESGGNPDLTTGRDGSPASVHIHAREPGNSVGPETETEPDSRNTNPDDQKAPVVSRSNATNAPGPGPSSTGTGCPPVAGKPAERRSVQAADYKRLDFPESHAVCWCCGRKGGWYVEKLTPERKARPKDQQDARRICRACYNAAVECQRAEAPPLPGTISLASMERCTAGIGRCSVCGLDTAVWVDRAAGVRLCQSCYDRETMRQVQGGNCVATGERA